MEPLFSRRFVLACAMHFCGAMAASFYILFPLFIRHLGGTELTIGLYAGLAGAAAVGARLPVGRLLDTQGRRRVLAVAGALSVAAWLGFLSVDSIGIASALMVVGYGMAAGSLFASYFTYASDIIPVMRRSEGFGLFGIWGMLPNGLGPPLAELLIHRGGFRAYFLAAAAFAFVSLCVSLFLPETAGTAPSGTEPSPPRDGTFPGRGLSSVLALAFLFATAMESVFVFIGPFAYARGRGSIGGFFLCYSLSAVAVRVFTGRVPDRVGLRTVLIPALFAYAAGVLLVPLVIDAWALLLVGALCGAGHGYLFPILNALAVQEVSPGFRGRAVTWLTAMFDLGNTVANPLLGGLADRAGFGALFATSGLTLLLTAVVVWWRGDAQGAAHDGKLES